jgi:hypothetical protein
MRGAPAADANTIANSRSIKQAPHHFACSWRESIATASPLKS